LSAGIVAPKRKENMNNHCREEKDKGITRKLNCTEAESRMREWR